MSDKHIKYLADLRRICGEKLAKSTGYKESSYLCSSNVQFIEDHFGISVRKDVEEVHPPCFGKKCRLTNSPTPVFWEPHQEEDCKTCNLASVVKKGGRPTKPKRGRGTSTAAATQKWQTESEVVDFCKTVDNLVVSQDAYAWRARSSVYKKMEVSLRFLWWAGRRVNTS